MCADWNDDFGPTREKASELRLYISQASSGSCSEAYEKMVAEKMENDQATDRRDAADARQLKSLTNRSNLTNTHLIGTMLFSAAAPRV